MQPFFLLCILQLLPYREKSFSAPQRYSFFPSTLPTQSEKEVAPTEGGAITVDSFIVIFFALFENS